jgi:hypothetical protein
MFTGYVRSATGIWRLWDMESERIVECSDVKFDEDSTAYMQDLRNEDPLGFPPEEPIYEEVETRAAMAPDEATTSTPDEVVAARTHEPVLAMGNRSQNRTHEPVLAMGDESYEPAQAVTNHEPAQAVTNHEPAQAVTNHEPERAVTNHEPERAVTNHEPERAVGSALRRSKRIKGRKSDVLVVDTDLPNAGPPPKDTDPRTYREAMACSLRKQWQEAMRKEYASLKKNNTFTPVPKSEANSEPIDCKWVYKTKNNPEGTLRYNARLVIKGYMEVEGVNQGSQ